MSDLSNKTAIITGSSRGIGAAIASHFAAAGANVVVNYAGNEKAANEVVAEITSAGGKAIAVQADVGEPADVTRLFDSAIAAYGKIDILVNNAGAILYKRLDETSVEEFDRLFHLNVRGVFLCLKEASKRLADGGSIINFSSTVTRVMMPTYGAYSATKAAVEQLTRVFAKEIGSRGIRVNSILPGATNTALFNEGKSPEAIKFAASLSAFNRIGEPDDIAKVALFLAGDESAWITAQSIGVNGGTA